MNLLQALKLLFKFNFKLFRIINNQNSSLKFDIEST